MSTRSRIAIKRKDGTIDSIYCHWDGYPEYNGLILHKYYKNENKIKKLLDLGDISILGRKLVPDPNKEHNFDKRQKNVVLAYKRDRGEKNTDYQHHADFSEFTQSCLKSDQNYAYLFDNNQWYVATIPYDGNKLNFNYLTDILIKENLINFNNKELGK